MCTAGSAVGIVPSLATGFLFGAGYGLYLRPTVQSWAWGFRLVRQVTGFQFRAGYGVYQVTGFQFRAGYSVSNNQGLLLDSYALCFSRGLVSGTPLPNWKRCPDLPVEAASR